MKPIVIVMVALCFGSALGALTTFGKVAGDLNLNTTPPPFITKTTPAPTPDPTTPQPTPDPTTSKPTTTTVPPSTTAAPVTTTPVPPPPSAKPGNWSYDDGTNRCVMVQMAIKIAFDYKTTNGSYQNATVVVPADAKNVTGSCNATQSLSVSSSTVNFTLDFTKEGEDYEISKIIFDIPTDTLPNSDGKPVQLVYDNKTTFKTPINHSYYCTRPQVIHISESNKTMANVTISHVQFEAFHTTPQFVFSAIRDCDAPETPDIVPIAVGIALTALVVVVLVAYLVARRRSQARGYTSM